MKNSVWKRRAGKWFVLIGIPIVLLVIGLWQHGRARTDSDVAGQIAEYKHVLQALEALEARDPSASVVVDDRGDRYAVSLVKDNVRKALDELEYGTMQRVTRSLEPLLSAVTAACGALALLCVAGGLFYQRRMASQAMRSRELLLQAFTRGKRLLPFYMATMVVLLFVAAITAMLFEAMPILRQDEKSSGEIKMLMSFAVFGGSLLVYGVMVIVGLIRSARRATVAEPIEVLGQMASRAHMPALWAFVEQVAERIGATLPDTIVVGLNEGFFVTEHRVRLTNGEQVPAGRVLYMPLPYLAFLDEAEVSAVIGHELGHFIGEDTLYSQYFSPIYSASIREIEAVAGSDRSNGGTHAALTRPATLFGEMFLASFHEAVRFWSRQRELAADAVGARAAGAPAVAASLLRIAALEPHVSEALARQWDEGGTLHGGVLAHVRALVAERGMNDPRGRLENRQAHPTDTHPELAQRLDALGMTLSSELLQRAMDAAGSGLLAEFGLEAQPEDTSAARPGPARSVDAALQEELSAVATEQRRQKIEALTEAVGAAGEPVAITERTLGHIVASLMLGGLAAVGAYALVSLDHSEPRAIGLALAVAVPLCLWWCVASWRRGRSPAFVIRRDGLQLFNVVTVLSWAMVDDIDLNALRGTLVVHVKLVPETSLPSLGVSRFRGWHSQKKNLLTVNLVGLVGKRAQDVVQPLFKYWIAHQAQLELTRMESGLPCDTESAR